MSVRGYLQRYLVKGVVWRQLLQWAAENIPYFLEPLSIGVWSGLFLVGLGGVRRAVSANLKMIFPDSSMLANFFRVYRLFWNFAWTSTDTMRFQLQRLTMDWEFVGAENLERLISDPRGAIILTAHMGNYDLGAYLFAEKLKRRITMIRVPELDPDTESFAASRREETGSEAFRVRYNVDPSTVALDLVESLRQGEVVAIQGDRVVKGNASSPIRFFEKEVPLPTGPFALAMVTRALIYPVFIVRVGRRRYRVIAREPIQCERTGTDRSRDIDRAAAKWRDLLETVIRDHWYQWFNFEPILMTRAESR